MTKDEAAPSTIQHHIFVPHHELLTEEESEKLLTTYNISRRQMPTISPKDPAIKHLNAQPGNIIKITRDSQTQGKAFFYRTVHE